MERPTRPRLSVGSIIPFAIAVFVALWFAPTARGAWAGLGGPSFPFVPIAYLALASATAGGFLAYRRPRVSTWVALTLSLLALAMDAAIILYFYWWTATGQSLGPLL